MPGMEIGSGLSEASEAHPIKTLPSQSSLGSWNILKWTKALRKDTLETWENVQD